MLQELNIIKMVKGYNKKGESKKCEECVYCSYNC